MRLVFVVQRYGAEVAGGAETLCRRTARELAARGHEVAVLTTTARDIPDWAPYFSPGVSVDNNVEVHRFHSDPPDPSRAAALERYLGVAPGDPEAERERVLARGPVVPELVAQLARSSPAADAVVLWSYLFATTLVSLPLVRDRSVIVPLAHPEPMLRHDLSRAAIGHAAAFAFLTREELRLVDDLYGIGDRPAVVVGSGLEPLRTPNPPLGPPIDLPSRYVLYLGRIESGKGVHELVRLHAAYRESGGTLGLVLAGRSSGSVRVPGWVTRTGFVDDTTRAHLLSRADLVALPSPYESLSLVAREAWQAGRVTLANAHCDVVAAQTALSGGGLLYDGDTYRSQVRRLAEDDGLRQALGATGQRWAAAQTWDACIGRWEVVLDAVVRTRAG